jgi:hypothetical protein
MLEPKDLQTGYYRVRRAKHWCVARWMPKAGQWIVGSDFKTNPGYWDEIGNKVA